METDEHNPASFPEKIYQILASDLTLSGFFKVIDVSRLPPSLREKTTSPAPPPCKNGLLRREILLAGEVLLEPNGLNFNVKFHLFDLVEQKHIIGKQYEGPLQTLRPAIHRMAVNTKPSSNHRETSSQY